MSEIMPYEIVDTPRKEILKYSKYAAIVKAIKALPAGKSIKFDASLWSGRKSHIGEPIRTACSNAGIKVSIQHDKMLNALFVTRVI